MMRTNALHVFLGVMVASATIAAQDASVRQVTNPYQEDHTYRVGTDLAPDVEIDGVRWTHARVDTKGGSDPEPGRDNTVFSTLRFDNRNDRSVNLTVVLMLEDAAGNGLERLVCPPMRLGGNRVKEFRQKFKISGDDLLSTRRAYLFYRVE